MIRHYQFDYDFAEALVDFIVDTKKFTVDMAKGTLEFFTWDYDLEANPIDEVMKKYAIEAIKIATFNNYNAYGVIQEFREKEGFVKLDGSMGIELKTIIGYEFDADKLDMEIS